MNTKYNLMTHCHAGLLVKTLFSQEIFVTSVGDLKLNSKKVSPTVQVSFLENILPSTSKYLLIKDTFSARYNLFIATKFNFMCRSLSVIQANLVSNTTKVYQTCKVLV